MLKKKIKLETVMIVVICCVLLTVSDSYENATIYKAAQMSSLLILGLMLLFKRKILLGDFLKFRVALLLYCLVSTLWSLYSRYDVIRVMLVKYLIVFLISFYCDKKERLDDVALGIGLSGIILCLEIAFSTNIVALQFRQAISGHNVNTVGMRLLFASICFAYLAQKRKIYYVGIIPCVAFMFLTGSKKTIVGLLVIAVLYALYYKKSYKKVVYVILGLALIIFAYNFLLRNEVLYDIIGKRLQEYINALLGIGKLNTSDVLRADLITEGMEVFREHPIRGIGISNFEKINLQRLYAHNNYVEMLCTLGIVGTVIYYSLFAKYIFALIKKIFDVHIYDFIALVILTVIAVNDYAMVSYYEFDTQLLVMFAIALYHIENGFPKGYVKLWLKKSHKSMP